MPIVCESCANRVRLRASFVAGWVSQCCVPRNVPQYRRGSSGALFLARRPPTIKYCGPCPVVTRSQKA